VTGGAVLTPSPLHGSHTYIGNQGLNLLLNALDDLKEWLKDHLSTFSLSQLSTLLYAVAGFVGNIAASSPLGPIDFVLAALGAAGFVTDLVPDGSGGKGQLNSATAIDDFIFDLKEEVRSLEGSWAKNRAFVFYETDTYGLEPVYISDGRGGVGRGYKRVLIGVAFNIYSYVITGTSEQD